MLDQITSCRDDLAQLYLMQALIQGFPDRFHLGTLETLLGVLPQLQPGVKVRGRGRGRPGAGRGVWWYEATGQAESVGAGGWGLREQGCRVTWGLWRLWLGGCGVLPGLVVRGRRGARGMFGLWKDGLGTRTEQGTRRVTGKAEHQRPA